MSNPRQPQERQQPPGVSDSALITARDAREVRDARELQPSQVARGATTIIMPLVDPDAAREAVSRYEALKAAIARESDYQTVNGRQYLKKVFWRRLGTFFGLTVERVEVSYFTRANGAYGYSAVYRAIAPNGASMAGEGLCLSTERPNMKEHDVMATACTRAKNRAISDLVGGGEVSADEVARGRLTDDHDEDEEDAPTRYASASSSQRTTTPTARTVTAKAAPAPARGINAVLDNDPDLRAIYDKAGRYGLGGKTFFEEMRQRFFDDEAQRQWDASRRVSMQVKDQMRVFVDEMEREALDIQARYANAMEETPQDLASLGAATVGVRP